MTERFCFAETVEGLAGALHTTISLRLAGFKTRLTTEVVAHFPLYVVHAIPATRPTRRERGCFLEGGR